LGCTHSILLPNTYYSPHGKHRFLCPQHWVQSANDNHPYPNGTWCATYADSIVLYWDQQQYRRTIKFLPNTNVGVIRTAPGIQQYAPLCSLIEKRLGTVVRMVATACENLARLPQGLCLKPDAHKAYADYGY
jgi:hypothetical protein